MKVCLEINDQSKNQCLQKLVNFCNGRGVFANIKDVSFSFELMDGRHIYLYGDVFYHIKSSGDISLIDFESSEYLKMVFSECNIKEVISNLEGQYIGICVDTQRNLVHIFGDRYTRMECFYTNKDTNFYFSTDLEFIFKNVVPEYDQRMLAHIFSVYGYYTPKGLTIYKNVRRLRVGEIVTLSDSGINSDLIEFKPLEIEEYTDNDLEVYYRVLKESVISRANRSGQTWVSSSSGWDSSILLGLLISEFGSQNVGMLSGSMKYSERTDVINKFEIDKINKIGEYYGIKPKMVEFDLISKKAPDYWQRILPYYKSRHMYTLANYNYSKLSDRLCNVAGKGQTIFNGETSDSLHNFGFSQFMTFFHTKKSFTEYADKMNCYLYGTSFFKKVLNGTYEKDKVFEIFKKMSGGVEFAPGWNSREDIIESYLFPFLYGTPRIPFAKTYLNPVLTEKGQKAIYKFPFRDYMPDLLSKISESNIYSWLIYLYQNFHSQGSTVSTPKYAMELNGHKCRLPFYDVRLISLLSKAPERWGRGLELNNTKYPLKWVAKNKIKFPYQLLDEGPHAYLWDVIEGISLAAEVVYRSGVTEFFKNTIKSRSYKNIIEDEYFDIGYLDRLCTEYLNGKEAKGIDLTNLLSLITLTTVGWY